MSSGGLSETTIGAMVAAGVTAIAGVVATIINKMPKKDTKEDTADELVSTAGKLIADLQRDNDRLRKALRECEESKENS